MFNSHQYRRLIFSPAHISDPILSLQLWLSREPSVVLLLKHHCPGLLSRSLNSICVRVFCAERTVTPSAKTGTCCYCAAPCWTLCVRQSLEKRGGFLKNTQRPFALLYSASYLAEWVRGQTKNIQRTLPHLRPKARCSPLRGGLSFSLFYKDWDRGHNTNCITSLFTKSLYRRLVAGTMMRKVSSASDGSLFRVKCMGKGADDRGCVGVSWNLRPPVCRLNADPLPGLFPHPRFCSPPGRGSAGLCGWSHRAGRRRRNGLLLWSPDERKHRVGHKELRDNDGVINIPRWMSKFNSSTDPPIHYLIFVTNGLKRICWNGAKSRNTPSYVFNFFYSSIYLLCFLSTFELLNQKKRGLNFSNLPLFSLLVCFSLVHTQSRCRCWSEIRRWRKWECRPGPGRFSPPWAS